MATKLAASYPQVQVYVIQPSVLDLLRCIYFAPKGGKLGAIIPFALRDYYDDLEDAGHPGDFPGPFTDAGHPLP
ncbi:hypothetical protein I3300191I4_08580 [Megasphaera elsdenii]